MVAGILEQPDLGVVFGEGADEIGGLVAGAVVDHDHLGIPAALVDAGDDGLKGAADARGLVVGGDHDAVGRIGHDGVEHEPDAAPWPAAGAVQARGSLWDMIAHGPGLDRGGGIRTGLCPKWLMRKG